MYRLIWVFFWLHRSYCRFCPALAQYFLFFLGNRFWDFMQIVSTGDNLHEMSHPVFWKNKKIAISLSSAKWAQRVVKVNTWYTVSAKHGLKQCSTNILMAMTCFSWSDKFAIIYVISDLGLHCLLRPVCPNRIYSILRCLKRKLRWKTNS